MLGGLSDHSRLLFAYWLGNEDAVSTGRSVYYVRVIQSLVEKIVPLTVIVSLKKF
jgi:hypothetical protein